MSNDAFYFGVLPILTKAAATYGISAAEMGRASLLGQPVHLLSPLVASTYLLVGMAKVDFGEHQRFTLLWAVGTTMVMLITGIVIGIIQYKIKTVADIYPLLFYEKQENIFFLVSPHFHI